MVICIEAWGAKNTSRERNSMQREGGGWEIEREKRIGREEFGDIHIYTYL